MRNSRICFAPADGNQGQAPSDGGQGAAPSNDGAPANDTASEAARIFNFDPFEPGSGLPQGQAQASDGQGVSQPAAQPTQPQQPAPAPQPSAGQPAQAPAAQPQAQPGQQPPAQPGAPAVPAPGAPQGAGQLSAEEAALLRQQVADLTARLGAANGQQPSQGQGQGQGQQPDGQAPEVETPPYHFTFPDQLSQMLVSENPQERLQATAALVTGAARNVHIQVVKAIRAEMQTILPHVIEHHIKQDRERVAIHNDFYGTFKDLNRPELKVLVRQVGAQVAAEYGNPGWSPQLRDAIGARVRQVLGGAAPAPVAPAPQQPAALAAQRPAQPPHMTGTTSRPAPANLPTQQQEMQDLLNF